MKKEHNSIDLVLLVITTMIGLICGIWFLVSVPVSAGISNEKSDHASPDFLKQYVRTISEEIGARPHNLRGKLNQTAQLVYDNFNKYGITRYQEYNFNNRVYKNVIVRLRGTNDRCAQGLYVVGAHYDTHYQNPGADDNASGVAGLIEMARIIKQNPLPCDVELVAYTLEELPNFKTENMGSFQHAKFLHERKEKVALMLSLEMIGYFSETPGSQKYPYDFMKYFYGDKANFIGIVSNLENRNQIRELKKSFLKTDKIKTKAISAPAFVAGIDFSDHLNYWKFGIPGVMITDTAFYRNPNYHKSSDTYHTLDYQKMASVVDSVYYSLDDLMK